MKIREEKNEQPERSRLQIGYQKEGSNLNVKDKRQENQRRIKREINNESNNDRKRETRFREARKKLSVIYSKENADEIKTHKGTKKGASHRSCYR